MGAAFAWGALAASSLVLGATLGLVRGWPKRQMGIVLAFGAGALISAVSFELAEKGAEIGGAGWVGVGLGVGGLTFFFVSRALEGGGSQKVRSGHRPPSQAGTDSGGRALALGAILDGIPEQFVLGISLTTGEGVSASLVVAIFISNLPEGICSASQMLAAGRGRAMIARLWVVVAVGTTLAAAAGYALADVTNDAFTAAINGFAAGGLLVMLIDSMIPEARLTAGRVAGLITVLGFAVAAGLSSLA